MSDSKIEEIGISDEEAAEALTTILGATSWEGVGKARGFLAWKAGKSDRDIATAAQIPKSSLTKKERNEFASKIKQEGLVKQLKARKNTGSSQNPVTKLFPAAVTEQYFLPEIRDLMQRKPSLSYSDDRIEVKRHTLADFRLKDGESMLPINVKNHGTRFEEAMRLVHLDPDDCIPIPAYKAQGAIEKIPDLLYAVAIDFKLSRKLTSSLPNFLSSQEVVAWKLLNAFSGHNIKSAEDFFVKSMVEKYWDKLERITTSKPYHVVSARKVIRILHTKPKRTPGIGMKAWGNVARAEVNVHLSVKEDMTPWTDIKEIVLSKGMPSVISAINKKVHEDVYAPEI